MKRIAILAGGVWLTIYTVLVLGSGRRVSRWDPDFLVFMASLALAIGVLMILTATGVLERLRQTRWFRGQETRCRECGYILRGVSEPRCPECGERI